MPIKEGIVLKLYRITASFTHIIEMNATITVVYGFSSRQIYNFKIRTA